MPYILEITGIVSYSDNSSSRLLAVDGIDGDITIGDKSIFNDAIKSFREVFRIIGANVVSPRIGTVKKEIRETFPRLSCWYTVGSKSYEFVVTKTINGGIIMVGDGNWQQFISLYKSEAEKFLRQVWPGTFVYLKAKRPVILTIKNNAKFNGNIAFSIHRDPFFGTDQIIERIVNQNIKQESIVIDFETDKSIWIHVRRFGIDPPPQLIDLSTQVSILGIKSASLIINGESQFWDVLLKDIVFE